MERPIVTGLYIIYAVRIPTFPTIDAAVTTEGRGVTRWLNDTLALNRSIFLGDGLPRLVVGLAYQGVPTPSILQLCVGMRCLIYQIRDPDQIPNGLRQFLTWERIRLVGIEDAFEVRAAMDATWRLQVRNLEEILDLAEERFGRPTTILELVEELLSLDPEVVELLLPEAIRTSRWNSTGLGRQQILFACSNAFLRWILGQHLTY